MKRWFIITLVLLMVGVAGVYAYTLTENTMIVVRYQGQTRITDMINSADPNATAGILTSESDLVMKFVSFPYTLPGTEITVVKYRCDFQKQFCGFCINATRGGKEVKTRSPIWISPPPYLVTVSESYNANKDELTITLKEDPIEATTNVLQRYVDMRPLGKRSNGGICK
jgi:hypothetical protein